MSINRGGYAGGIVIDPSVSGEDIMPAIRESEALVNTRLTNEDMPFNIFDINLTVSVDTTITINDGTRIVVTATKGYTNNSVLIKKLKIHSDAVKVTLSYNYI